MNVITIFMNSEKSKTSNPHRLLLKRSDNYIALSNLSIYYTWTTSHAKTINLKDLLQHGTKNWITRWMIFCIRYSRFKYIIKKHEAVSNNPPIRIYINRTENRITFRIKTGYWAFNAWNDEIIWNH